ncbi:metal ABC transporter solute-binding protein, Zn/Mn family [Piscinibacter koreensis]|uniref:Zinc ABC transporter substrate-binding protein n=1 Tax=Piscinibacter koreensis TaxID=2742824 RepID=A0A7Y6NNY8_9BURK|nr:zinc ABC transporter substrate-binding protein [Schlegelella koreensis]NUZ06687.1 zinc ABC transporter substrate-binding protein [Schlegelella koreensis]
MMLRRQILLAGSALLARPVRGATGPAGRVVASFSILADIAHQLLPAGIEVASLVGPDADAHVYEPSAADARRLATADLVLVNGLGFEGWMERLVRLSAAPGAVITASAGLEPRTVAGVPDPHVWQSLTLMRRYTANLAAAFARRWPAAASEIRARSTAYLAQLEQLDARIHGWIDAIPRQQRRVITSHDAFGYFGHAYGIDFLAPQGWSTLSEPSAAAVARLIRQVQRDGVRALFVENISDPRLIERIAREGGARVGGVLYSDALSRRGGPAETYVDLMAHNARTLVDALSH